MPDEVQTTADANARWFADNDGYVAAQSGLAHYRHIARMVRRELRGVDRLLDVGNGGFFNYDVSVPRHVTAVDLFLAVPQMLVVLIAMTTVGAEPWLVVGVVAAVTAPRVARVVHGAAVAVVEQEFVRAS